MVLLRLFDYQGALTVRYHRLRSFYRRRLFAAYKKASLSCIIFSFTMKKQRRFYDATAQNICVEMIYVISINWNL